MQFNYIRFSGFRPFTGEVVVNFDALPGRIIALVGPNGSGKTRLLELLAGGVHRTMPTRGKVNALAADRKTMLEVGATTDHRYVFRQIIDAHTGRAEAVVIGSDGLPLTDSGKLPEFDDWVARHLPSPDVLYATTFASQGSTGFFGLSKAERKHVMLAALLIEHYETLAEAARQKMRDAQTRLEITLAKYNELHSQTGDIEALSTAVLSAKKEEQTAREQLSVARAALKVLEDQARTVSLTQQRIQHARDNAARLDADLQQALLRIGANDEKRKALSAVVSRRSEIEKAVASLAQIDTQIETVTSEAAERRADVSALSERIATATANIAANETRRQSANTRAVALRVKLADRKAIEADAARLPQLEATLMSLAEDVQVAVQRLRKLRDTTLADAGDRINKLRLGLTDIRDSEHAQPVFYSFARSRAGSALETDDKAVAKAATLPADIEQAEKLERAAREKLDTHRAVVETCRQKKARLAELDEAAADLKTAEQQVADAELDAARLEEQRDALMHERKEHDDKRLVLEKQHSELKTQREPLAVLAADKAQLDFADSRQVELKTEARELLAEKRRIEAERALIVIETDPDPVDTSDAELEVSGAELTLQQATSSRASAEAALNAAQEVADRIKALGAMRLADELEVADYTRLAFELGRDGLQALEIDAAGPELTELVNDLLHTCFGDRWTVEIETVRDAKNGKKQIEVFDGLVHDNEEGDKTFEQLSGGQQVIIGEAFSLALTMLACRRAGITAPMLIRDETGAALDSDTGPAYVAMLRRAADIVGASKVIFVSHNPDLQPLADSRLYLAKGKVCTDENEAAIITRLENSFEAVA